jgi:hypothetical protein
MGVVERFVGLGFLECFRILLICWQVAFPNSRRGCRVDFLEGHYSNYLFEELGISNSCHHFKKKFGFLLVFVGGNKCE